MATLSLVNCCAVACLGSLFVGGTSYGKCVLSLKYCTCVFLNLCVCGNASISAENPPARFYYDLLAVSVLTVNGREGG